MALSACDSSAPDLVASPPAGAIEIAPDRVTVIDLAEVFTSGTDGAVRYNVQSVAGPIRAGVQRDAALAVEPTDKGVAEVLVVAYRGDERVQATLTFAIPTPAPLPDAARVDLETGAPREVPPSAWRPAGLDASVGFRIEAVEGPAAVVLGGDGTLLVTPDPVARERDVGVTLVTTRFVPRRVQARLRLLPQCPAQPEGTVDYFPLAEGDTRSFDLAYTFTQYVPTFGTRYQGTQRWTVTAETCRRNVRTWTVEATFEGGEDQFTDSGWAEVGPTTQTRTLEITEDSTATLHLGGLAVGQHEIARARRYHPVGSPAEVTESPAGPAVTLRRGDGLARLSSSRRLPFRVSIDYQLTVR